MILQLETPAPDSALRQRLTHARSDLRSALIVTSQPALHDRVLAAHGSWPATPVAPMPYQKKRFWLRIGM
jgi:hypothetical protein